jgi:hypothetical protein
MRSVHSGPVVDSTKPLSARAEFRKDRPLRRRVASCMAHSIALVVITTGCMGDSPATPSPPKLPVQPSAGSTMSAAIDGAAWTATFAEGIPSSSGDAIFISGSTGAGTPDVKSVSIIIQLATGAQILVPPLRTGIVIIGPNSWSSTVGGDGSAVVDSLGSHRITGTFQFTAQTTGPTTPATRRITAGRFGINF